MKTRELVILIGMVLPAMSYKDIADSINGMEERRGHKRVTVAAVGQAILYLRRHAAEFGWSIPHCRGGPALNGDYRLIAALEKPGQDRYVKNDGRSEQVTRGMITTLLTTSSRSSNEAAALENASKYQTNPATVQDLQFIITDLRYLARKSADLVAKLRDKV